MEKVIPSIVRLRLLKFLLESPTKHSYEDNSSQLMVRKKFEILKLGLGEFRLYIVVTMA